jgi:flagellar assembly protein FliH
MARLRRDVLDSSEAELVRLALAIAERIVGRELAVDPELVVAWAKESIQTLGAGDDVVIALAPDVAASLPEGAWADLDGTATVRTDSLLSEGSLEVRSPEGRVAAGAQARKDAVAEALGVVEP